MKRKNTKQNEKSTCFQRYNIGFHIHYSDSVRTSSDQTSVDLATPIYYKAQQFADQTTFSPCDFDL